MMKHLGMIFILLLHLFSCSSNKTPEKALKDYVNYRFSAHQERGKILKHVAKELYQRIDSMNKKEFSTFVDINHLKKKNFKINLKKCSEDKCFITYTIKYDQYKKKKRAFVIEAKKIAHLIEDEEGWKVADVNDIKTHLDSKESLIP